jgi:hypothetical protein
MRACSSIFSAIWFVLETLLDLALETVGLGAPDRPSYAQRLQQAKTRHRNRAIRRWLDRGDERGPIPKIGLVCPKCEYSLAGLTEMQCPECGSEFDVASMIDHRVGFRRTRKRREARE